MHSPELVTVLQHTALDSVVWKDYANGYSSIRKSHKDWIYTLRTDAASFRQVGVHAIADDLNYIALQHASIVIGRGCF